MNGLIDSQCIAENIKRIRLSNKLTQMDMADLLGYSERQIRRLETEGTSSLAVINMIAKRFNVSALSILVSND